MTFLTLLQSPAAPPDPTPENPADIGPGDGDYSALVREFPLRPGEEIKKKPKRRRLPKSVVKRAKVIARMPDVSPETLMELARVAMPSGSEDDITSIALMIMHGFEEKLGQALIYEQAERARQAQLERLREQIIIEKIAQYLDILEQDEILLAYLM